jgi:hypothetical protein
MRTPLLIFLAACGFEHGAFEGKDASPDADGDGAVSSDDEDGDSVEDDADNCPLVANTDQRNHDGDPHGDACDGCPGLASSIDPDSDGDGVGDDCDPRPSIGGDTTVLFEGFYDPGSIALWNGVGAWAVSNGRLVQSSTTTDYAHLSPPISPAIARHSVMASVRLDVIGVSANGYDPGVAVAGGIAPGRGCFCVLQDNGSMQMAAYAYWFDFDHSTSATDSSSWTGTFTPGTDVTLFGRIVGPDNRCTVSEGGSISIFADDAHGPTDGDVELVTSRMAASFDYVFVVAVGS